MSAPDTCYFLRQFRLKRRLRLEAEKRKIESEIDTKNSHTDFHTDSFILEALCGSMGRVMP